MIEKYQPNASSNGLCLNMKERQGAFCTFRW